jgi:Domain of unknown function (DUF4839)/PASTA domain
MRALRIALPLIVAFGLVGCGAAAKDVTMPDVTGKKLDVAYDKIKSAGFDNKDKIKIEGGGTFGVVTEGKWTVCEQSPAAGKTVSGAPTLTVERSCDNSGGKGSDEPSQTPSETPTASDTPTLPAVLTVKNNPEFSALLKVGDNCSGKVTRFAKKYTDQTIQFDGSIQAMAPHGNYKTRFDILVGPGNFDPNKAIGPTFQFNDKNVVYDLHLTGKHIPDYVKVGQNYTFTAQLGDYDPDSCLYQLSPVETKVR